MLAVDGVLLWRATLASGWRFLFARDGLLRGQGLEYRAWFRRDVHPGPNDDAPLIAAWRPRIGAGAAR